MVNSNFLPQYKKPGDLILSADWNAAMSEIKRLENAKVNREGADTLKGPLTIQEALNVTGDVKISGKITVNNTVSLKGSADKIGLSVDANGNVGIGTTTPKIHLAIGDDDTGLKQQGDGQLAIYTDNTERMRITASGNVGIGTTTPKIHLAIGDDDTGLKQQGDGQLAIYTDNTERMRINASGNVGIGTTSPTEKLEVNGNIKATNAAFTDTLTVTGKSTLTGSLAVNNIVSLKGSADTTGLSVNATGNVGIGTTSPTEKLEVSGNIKATNAAFAGTLTVTGNSTLTGSLTVNNTVYLKGSTDTTGLSVNASGKVGIGTTNPQATLAINGGLHVGGDSNPGDKNLLVDGRIKLESGVIQRGGDIITGTSDLGLYSQQSGSWMRFVTNNAPIRFFTENGNNGIGSTSRMVISGNGNVGIGIDNPTKGKLEIVGGVEYTPITGLGSSYFSLYADNRIGCSSTYERSDARIKLTQGRSNSNADLRLLRQIEITDYTLKDTISNFSGIHKKVIGQQISQVFPQAVSTVTDVVPDIFKSAFISNNWINLPDHGLTVGERVKIIQGTEANIFTVEAIELDSFKVPLSYNGEVFVYGREVNDFHLVDYNALSMLNISATQELYRIIETLQTEVEQLKAQLHQDKPNKLPISAKQ